MRFSPWWPTMASETGANPTSVARSDPMESGWSDGSRPVQPRHRRGEATRGRVVATAGASLWCAPGARDAACRGRRLAGRGRYPLRVPVSRRCRGRHRGGRPGGRRRFERGLVHRRRRIGCDRPDSAAAGPRRRRSFCLTAAWFASFASAVSTACSPSVKRVKRPCAGCSSRVERGYRAALKASHGVKRSTVMAGPRCLTNRTRCSPGPAKSRHTLTPSMTSSPGSMLKR
jgi:hypothetical protein